MASIVTICLDILLSTVALALVHSPLHFVLVLCQALIRSSVVFLGRLYLHRAGDKRDMNDGDI